MEPLSPPPALTHLFTLRCAVDPPLEIGKGPYGRRRCVPIKSGTVRGKYLVGEVVPGGADFMYTPHYPYLIGVLHTRVGNWRLTRR